MVSNPRWSHFSLSVKTLTYCFCFILFFTFTNKLIKLLWLDPQFRCLTFMFLVCQLMGPVIFPRKTYLGIWVSFPWGVSFQFFEEHFYVELSHLPPPPLPTPLESSIKWASQQRACRYNQGSGHITFSWFRVEMLLKKGFQLRTASTQQQALILLNSDNQETHLGLRKQKTKIQLSK